MTGTHVMYAPPGSVPDGLLAARDPGEPRDQSIGLPDGIWRDQFVELIVEIYRSELTPADERVLRHYALKTRPQDWSEPGGGPVCYVGQLNTAEKLGLDRKTVYTAECKLERLGIVIKTALPNGHRRGPRGSRHVVGALGIAFYPAINAYDHLVARRARADAAAEAFAAARLKLLRVRATLASKLRTSCDTDPVIETIRAEFAALPRRLSRIDDLTRIEALTNVFQRLLDDLDDQLGKVEAAPARQHRASARCGEPDVTPHEGGAGSPHLLYTTTNSSDVTCTAHAAAPTGARGIGPGSAPPANPGERLETKPVARPTRVAAGGPHKESASPINWKIGTLVEAASDDFRAYLALFEPCPARLRSDHFVEAAAELAAALGVDRTAWDEACRTLGRFEAALAVLVLDANRTHPVRPVENPGGVLRGMTRKHRSGALNLDASLFAILARPDQGRARLN